LLLPLGAIFLLAVLGLEHGCAARAPRDDTPVAPTTIRKVTPAKRGSDVTGGAAAIGSVVVSEPVLGAGAAGHPVDAEPAPIASAVTEVRLAVVGGRVVDSAGTPVPNATVRLAMSFLDPHEMFYKQRPVGSATSGPDGRFTVVPGALRSDAALYATAIGRVGEARARGTAGLRWTSLVPGASADFGDVVIQASTAGFAELHVLVRAAGRPVEGATVELGFGYLDTGVSDWGGASVETDALGEVTQDLCAYSIQVHVKSDGFATEHRHVDRVQTEDVTVEVNLAVSSAMRGRVLDPEGRPVAHASVEAHEYLGPGRGREDSIYASTNGDGRYLLETLAPGRDYWVSVQGRDERGFPGELSLAALSQRVTTPRTEDLDFQFARAGRLSVELRVDRGHGEVPDDTVGEFLERSDPVTGAWLPHETGERVIGNFGFKRIFARLVPGTYRVLCFGNSAQPTYSEPGTVASGDDPVQVVAHAKRGRLITGRVVDVRGDEVNKARVGFEIGPWLFGVHDGDCASHGSSTGFPYGGRLCLWDMPFEELRVYVTKRGYESLVLTVPAGRSDVALGDLLLSPSPEPVSPAAPR
jgi:protocatechuate 3,4-dioxygenase beta subunit